MKTKALNSLPARSLAERETAARLELKRRAARFNLIRERNLKALKGVLHGPT